MLKSFEARIEKDGKVQLPIRLAHACRAIVTILDDVEAPEISLLSEKALEDWNRPEEDEAWKDFQKDQ